MRNFSEIVTYSGYSADRIGGLTLAWSSNISIIFIRSARFIQPKLRPSDREKWSTSKGGPVFSKLFWLDQIDPLSFGPKFPEISVEWIAPVNSKIALACLRN